ncbi:LacI family DNA-binding transcriptional regulator [Belliella kenyensis]|uniref:LacI family DNA-binding transcriptional regulator n=1 Tax=Belliella kenyensis TaxID=1472724 RepID=A0ABV8EN48_9BACT|nr:LacI family DNA-binding transcriptional regulator [Belliella kenyensis]MCH7400584.1 LacI family transcriptional regulator [Belliella kenyensis]MDN3602129.1 LacI family DNA-binding transcriptional regulator [Belliella kenyensis]
MRKDHKRVSIKDIAQALGVSITTVSFVINGKARNKVSEELIKKVEAYIEKVGYIPNVAAQSLRTGKSNTIVFMAEDISDPFFAKIAKRMESFAFEHGYKIVFCSTENNKDRAIAHLTFFKDKGIDAYIITPPEHFEEEAKSIMEQGKVTVFFDRRYNSFDHHYVVLDNYRSIRDAVRFMQQKGYSRIGFVGLESDLSTMKERENGYLDQVETAFVLKIDFKEITSQVTIERLEQFLIYDRQFDIVVFASNSLAIAGLRVMQKHKVNIPDSLGVLTFDDRELFELYNPPISVISQPVGLLAEELITTTIKLLSDADQQHGFIQKSLPGKLIARYST